MTGITFKNPKFGAEIAAGVAKLETPVATACTSAIKTASDAGKKEGRANIAASGMGSKWQNTFRALLFPKRGISIDAAAFFFHKIFYADVFEEGAKIKGRPLIWVPLRNVPTRGFGSGKPTPKKMAAKGVKFVSINRTGHKPLLAAQVRVPKSQRHKTFLKISAAKLRAGTGGRGVLRAVPLFIGLNSITIRKRWKLTAIITKWAGRLSELYESALKVPTNG